MKNKFLTIQVWRFLYHMARIKKRKAKPLVRKMSDSEWDLAMEQIEDIKMEQAVRS